MAWNLIRPNNEEIYAKRLQIKELLTDELEATELIAKKIRSSIGGKSMSVWDAGESYSTGDLTFYNGCLYSSLIDSNVSIPTPASPDWIKVSRVKNSRLYFVDNIAGDDSKATNDCADYSFFSLDGCIDYVTATHPAGNVSIVLLNTGINYTLSRDLTLNEFTISAADSAPRSHAHFIQIDVQNTILITGNNVSFNGLGITYDDTAAPANMFIFEGGVLGIFDCRLVKLDPANSLMVLRSTTTPGWTRNDVYLTDTIRSGLVAGGNFEISFDDSSGVPYNGELVITNSPGWIINENLNPAVTTVGAPLIRTNNVEITVASIVVSSFIGLNCNFFNFTNSANSPAYIGLVGCNTHATFGPGYFTFSKTGTANYIFTMCDFGPSPTIAAGATRSEYQSGYPLHNYHANNTYNDTDIVFNGGDVYRCRVTPTTGITPGTDFTRWLPLTQFNQGSSWGAPLGAFTTLTTGLTVTSDKLNLPTLLADHYALLSTVTANSFRIVKPGLYQIVMNLETTTTQVAGQDTIHDVAIGLSSDSNVANSLSRVSGQRGLVSNSTTYAINDSRLTLSLALPTGSPNLNVDLSIYCRTTGTNAYNALIVKFFVERENPL